MSRRQFPRERLRRSMAVTAEQVARLRRLADARPAESTEDLQELQTSAEVIAYTIAQCRVIGEDEADAIELLVRATDMYREDIAEAEKLLRKLGYGLVCDRLRVIAKKAKHGPPRQKLAPHHEAVIDRMRRQGEPGW